LFSLCPVKYAKVAELGSWSDGVWVWHLAWRKPFFDWEKPMVDQLCQALHEVRMVLGKAEVGLEGRVSLDVFS